MDNTDCRRPVIRSIAVHEGGQAANSKCNVRSRAYGDVVQCTDQGTVGCAGLPSQDFRRDGDAFVRAAKGEASDHGGVAGMSVTEVEPVYDFVDECSLREGDGARQSIAGEGDS
jgi:hypothetical protein